MSTLKNLFDVNGKKVFVTGASSGIGRSAATCLAESGAKVVAIARRADRLKEWSDETNGETSYFVADVSNKNQIKTIVAKIIKAEGSPDILINAAGLNTREHADDVTLEGWDKTLDLNLSTPFFIAQAIVKEMKKRKWGRIINYASLASRRALPSSIAYGASKGGIEQLTRAMAEAWSPFGINVNAIAPGFFPTELTVPVFNDKERSIRNAKQTCIGRNGELQDLNGPLLFLCSKSSDYVTGQLIFVDGGFTAK